MNQLPQGWVTASIGQLIELNPKTDANDMTLVAFSPMNALGARFLDPLRFETRQWGEVKKSYTHFAEGDVLLAKITPCFENGKAGIAKDLPSGLGAGSSEFFVCRPRPKSVEARYLLAWVSGDDFRARGVVQMTGSVGHKRVPKEFLLGDILPFAPYVEQQRIADKLDAVLARVDACRDRLARVVPLLKRFRQSVLAAATSGRLTEDWRSQSEAVQVTLEEVLAARREATRSERDNRLLDELIATHHPLPSDGEIPRTWVHTCVGLVGIVSNGSTPSRAEPAYWNGSIPWVSSGEVQNREITATRERITELGFKNSSVKLLPPGTVLIAMIGEGKTRGQSALLCLPACINQNVAGVVPISKILHARYLWQSFQSQYEATRLKGNGTGPQALNCQRVRELTINLAPLPEQDEIVRRVDILFAYADRIEARLTQAKTATDRLTPALLAKAFRGELVPQDPNDEPASELLKRLAANRNEPGKKEKPRRAHAGRASK